MADYDPRIVDLYDGDNPDGPDHDFYRELAERGNSLRILDVGCGTGMLTVTFAAAGREVVGVDPSPSMISYARQRTGADGVTWIEGDTRALPSGPFDLIVMTGNVAQHIPDPQWERTLNHLRGVAETGTLLAFESRNPSARAWDEWNQPVSSARETMHGLLREWAEVEVREGGQVLLRSFNHFEATNEIVREDQLLTFRSVDVVAEQLAEAGFEVQSVWGDWAQTPFDDSQPLMVFEARAC